jgi:hypothetical protein
MKHAKVNLVTNLLLASAFFTGTIQSHLRQQVRQALGNSKL